MPIYEDPVLVKIREVLNAEGPARLKNRYGLGDPIVVSASQLPMAFISYDIQAVSDLTNAELQSQLSIVINLAYDMKRDFGQGLSNVEGHMSVVELLSGRKADYSLRTDSIMGCLRKHQELDSKLWIDIGTMSEVDYGVGLEKRGPGIYTAEGVVRFRVTNHQLKPEYQ